MGVRIGLKLTYEQRVFQKTHLFKIWEKNLKCDLWIEVVLQAKKVFYWKMFRDPKNGGVGFVQIWPTIDGCPKKIK